MWCPHRNHRYGLIGNGRLLGGYTIPENPTHAGLLPYPFDVSKARQLLQEAGYKHGLTLSNPFFL